MGMPPITYEEIDRRMNHHPPREQSTIAAHETARDIAKAATKALLDLVQPGREAALVATAMGEALMYANQGIALHGLREGRTLTDVEEIRHDFGIGYGVLLADPADGGELTAEQREILRDVQQAD